MKKIITCILIYCAFSANAQTGMLNGTGYAPNFTVTDINGISHTISDYIDSGYVMVLELLSTTCGHCQTHAAGTENSYMLNGPDGTDVARFLGLEVNASTDSTAVANFATNYGVEFPIANSVSPADINYQLYYTPGYYIIYPDYTYTTICAVYCVSAQSSFTIEGLLNTAIAAWIPPVYGCTDSTASNYNLLATVNDTSCIFLSSSSDTSRLKIHSLIDSVMNADFYNYDTKDNLNQSMDCAKIISNPNGGFIAVYHHYVNSIPQTFLATSIDFINWNIEVTLGSNASQPTIAEAIDGGYIVAWEQEPNNHLKVAYYNSLATLFSGIASNFYDIPQSLSVCAEGTPNIYPSTSNVIDIGFHYYDNCLVDRQARGILTDFNYWDAMSLTDLDTSLIILGVEGNIGDRDPFIYDGYSFVLIEGQLINGDFSSWRTFIHDYQTGESEQIQIVTHNGSVALANPTISMININGNAAILTTIFIHSGGSGIGEPGQLLYYRYLDLNGCTDPFALNYDSLATLDNGSCCGLQLDWEKIAQDIDGEASVDASGRAISFNSAGDIVAVGARWNDGNGTDAGHVRVYQNIGNSWIQLGQDIDGENTDDFSGHSLAINGEGDRVAIGAYGNDDNGTNAGQVRVYEYNGSTWIQLGQDIDGELANDFKGFQVDINQIGDKIVVGSYGNDDNGINAGKTQVYYFDGNTWIQFGSNIYGENPNDASGKSLQISGLSNIIAIGAASNADNGTNSGQVRVFEFYNGDWVQMGQDINGESNGDFSGAAISLNNSGNIIAIGAKRNDGNGSNAGHVRVFKYAANSWVQIGQDIDGLSTGDESGYSLSLNGLGNKIAIGSCLNSDSLTESGHVRVFYFDATSWKQIGNDIYGEFPNDWSGRSVALNEIGDKLAIGADLNDGNGAHSGHVRVFSYNISCLQGCTDIAATNYDSTAIIDDGSCFIYGCTGPTYCNYDANATMDDGSCVGLAGCMDPLYNEYNSIANCDDGSCVTIINALCSGNAITGLFVSGIIDDRAVANFDNMNTYDASGAQICRVDQIRIKYREVGTSGWSQKNIASPTGYDAITGICNSTQKTDKNIYNLNPATEYQWQVKLWYCSNGATSWAVGPNFTTLGECPNIGNFTAYGATSTKATFDWDDSNGSYEFVRIKMRVDSISIPQGTDWFQVGGFGVTYGTFTKNKNGVVAGETYRAQARTWCDPNGGAYNSLAWTALATWTQPTSNRIDGADAISNLDIYPNPSRDIFNVTFTSETIQDLKVRILNIVGEDIINEDLQQFAGEYVKVINLNDYSKGVYFLEIETKQGVINKKLILQ